MFSLMESDHNNISILFSVMYILDKIMTINIKVSIKFDIMISFVKTTLFGLHIDLYIYLEYPLI